MDRRQESGITHWSNTARTPRIAGVNANIIVPWAIWVLFLTNTYFFMFCVFLTALAIWVQVVKRMSFPSAFRSLRIMLTGRLKTTRSPLRNFIRR